MPTLVPDRDRGDAVQRDQFSSLSSRDDMRRLYYAARLAHGTAWEPTSPWQAFRKLTLVEKLAVVAGGFVFAIAVFLVVPLFQVIVVLALTGQVPS